MSQNFQPREFSNLRQYSAKIGTDNLLVQAAGGNTSIKFGDKMWIKASGTWLKDALSKEIFVPVDWQGIASAVYSDATLADSPDRFQLSKGLRPSIETCLHAVLPHKVVIHVHCVDSIALAMQKNARSLISKALSGLNAVFVPYRKPGAQLAKEVLEFAKPETDVFFLGNHGLIVCAQSVVTAEALMNDVTNRIRTFPQETAINPPDYRLEEYPSDRYHPAPEGHGLNQLAFSKKRVDKAVCGGLFPDQVVFCGPVLSAMQPEQSVRELVRDHIDKTGEPPVAILIREVGALIYNHASSTQLEMAKCVGNVLLRVPADAELNYLSDDECAALLNWDAEKYRVNLSE